MSDSIIPVPDDELLKEANDTKPRTVEQVRFEPDLPWERAAEMYQQCVADGGHTMSYAERAREVLRCVATAADASLSVSQHEHLEAIGRLLVVWEGVIHLLGEKNG